jgi:hypothetical protein
VDAPLPLEEGVVFLPFFGLSMITSLSESSSPLLSDYKKKKSVGKGESHAQHEVLIATAALAGGSTDLVIYLPLEEGVVFLPFFGLSMITSLSESSSPLLSDSTTPSSKGKGASKSTKDENDKKKKSVGKGESHAQHEERGKRSLAWLGGLVRGCQGAYRISPGQLSRQRERQSRHDPRRGNQGQEGLLLLQVEIDQAPLVRRRL